MNKWAIVAGVALIAAFCVLGFLRLERYRMPRVDSVAKVEAAQGRQVGFTGGIIRDTVKHNPGKSELIFQLRDGHGRRLEVRYKGTKPTGFDSTRRVTVVGAYSGGRFAAQQLFIGDLRSKP